jgi:hypothetical protein
MHDDVRSPNPDNADPAPQGEAPTTHEPADEPGAVAEPVGNDNIREGRVQGLMGTPHGTQGQGQGG